MYKSKYFSPEKDPMLYCPCCHQIHITDKLYETLDAIRDYLRKPVIIVSGYRCPAYNATLPNSVPHSGHTTGEAADIKVEGYDNKHLGFLIKRCWYDGLLPHLTYCYLIKGKTQTSVHVGVDIKPQRKSFFGF